MASKVSWSKLQTAYGEATGLDATLASLRAKKLDVRAAALLTLEGCIAHQGSIYSATAPCVPLLVQLLRARPPSTALALPACWERSPGARAPPGSGSRWIRR
jgi:hypothetical protein